MRTLCLAAFLCLSGCATGRHPSALVGTWKMRGIAPSTYYLRIYQDGTVAQWPSPPEGTTAWTRLEGGNLLFGYQPPLRNPHLSRRGSMLVMHDEGSDDLFDRVVGDLQPPP